MVLFVLFCFVLFFPKLEMKSFIREHGVCFYGNHNRKKKGKGSKIMIKNLLTQIQKINGKGSMSTECKEEHKM